jgi:hypothetical protein
MLEDGQHERRCFAGPCLGKAHNVFAGKDRRDGLLLDGGRDLIAERPNTGLDLRMKIE